MGTDFVDRRKVVWVNLRLNQVHVYQLRRSGGHGVIDWLLEHPEGDKVHYNDALPIAPGRIGVLELAIHFIRGVPGRGVCELISFEDECIETLATLRKSPRLTVLILRDPFNTFASRLARIRQSTRRQLAARLLRINPERWKEYAREFVAPHHLPGTVRLNFNRWYLSAEYRRDLSSQLGWPFTDRGFGSKEGWRYSRGSSFGDADPQHLDLFNRWKVFEKDAEYRSYFDDEVRELSQQIFGWTAPL